MENKLVETDWMVAEKVVEYGEDKFPLQQETKTLIGICMEVHRYLGHGFLEVIYKDAIEKELKWKNIPYQRERKFEIDYKGEVLPHYFSADFVVYENVILEVKAQVGALDMHYKQVINYLAVSKCPVALLINFGEPSLKFKRVAFLQNKPNL